MYASYSYFPWEGGEITESLSGSHHIHPLKTSQTSEGSNKCLFPRSCVVIKTFHPDPSSSQHMLLHHHRGTKERKGTTHLIKFQNLPMLHELLTIMYMYMYAEYATQNDATCKNFQLNGIIRVYFSSKYSKSKFCDFSKVYGSFVSLFPFPFIVHHALLVLFSSL